MKQYGKYGHTTYGGNQRDGWEVNDRYCLDRKCVIQAPITTYNSGTEAEFKAASPTNDQISEIFDVRNIEIDGDDISIYVSREGYPIGELHCVSHKSLSPIKN